MFNIFKKSEMRKLLEAYVMADTDAEQAEILKQLENYPYN